MALNRGNNFPIVKDKSEAPSIADVMPISTMRNAVVPVITRSSLQSLGRLSRTGWGMFNACRATLQKIKAEIASDLLSCVTHSNYKRARQILARYPRIMFEIGKAQERDGTEIEITPLKQIIRISHKRMFDIFKMYAHLNMEKFLQHAAEQQAFINLDAFSKSCQYYDVMLEYWNNSDMSDEDLMAVWHCYVGGAQQAYLPTHLLHEMLLIGRGEDDRWTTKNTDFDEPLPETWHLSFIKLAREDNEMVETLDPYQVGDLVLGRDFAYYRGPTCFPRCDLGFMEAKYDVDMMQHVLTTWRQQITEALAFMKIELDTNASALKKIKL